jgi:hypothetical protein
MGNSFSNAAFDSELTYLNFFSSSLFAQNCRSLFEGVWNVPAPYRPGALTSHQTRLRYREILDLYESICYRLFAALI